MKYYLEKIIEKIIMLIAFSAISILIIITFFIFKEGCPFLFKNGILNFILSPAWDPSTKEFGIFTMILGSLWVTVGALIFGVPLGISCAIYLAEFADKTIRGVLKPMIELLAGIPSVVYGFIGVMILAPIIRTYLGGPGFSILAAAIILGIMILPTVISISMDSIMALPRTYKEGSIALGATRWQTVKMVLLPAARSGILAGVILGMGRAIGETMAVIMITGNAIKIPFTPLDSVRTMTSNIALEMGYAIGDHRAALFATAVMLFVFIMILNTMVIFVVKRKN